MHFPIMQPHAQEEKLKGDLPYNACAQYTHVQNKNNVLAHLSVPQETWGEEPTQLPVHTQSEDLIC